MLEVGFFRGVNRYHRSLRYLWLALIVIFAGLGAGIHQDFSVESYFPHKDPARHVYEAFKKIYPQEDGQIVVLWQHDHAVEQADVERMRDTENILNKSEFTDISWFGTAERLSKDGENIDVLPLFPGNEDPLSYLKKYKNEPFYQGLFWDREQRVLVIRGQLPPQYNNDIDRRRIENTLTERLEALETEHAHVFINGLPILRARYLKLMAKDQAIYLAGGLLLCFLLMFLFFKSMVQVVTSLLAIMPAYLATLAALAQMDRPLTALTAIVPLILLIVGLSDSIHLLTCYRQQRAQGVARDESIIFAFSKLWLSCFFTSFTTAAGFLCLLSTGIDIVIDFAAVTSIAIMLTYVSMMLFVPAFLMAGKEKPIVDLPQWPLAPLAALQRVTDRYRWPIVIGTLACMALCVIPIQNLGVNSKLIDEKDHHPLVQDITFAEQHGFGLFTVNVFLRGPDLVRLPTIRWMRDLDAFIQKDPLVLKTVGLHSIIDLSKRQLNDETLQLTPGMAGEQTDIELLRALREDPRAQKFVRELYDPISNTTQVAIYVRDAGSKITTPFIARLKNYMHDHPPPSGFPELTGTVVLSQLTFDRLVSGFAKSLLWAIAVMVIIFWIQLRSIPMAFLALLPNLLPLAALLAGLALFHIPLTPAIVLVFSIAFGIAVDDTIHFLGAAMHERKLGYTWAESSRRAYQECGHAMVMTTIIIASGFSVMLASSFLATAMLGLLTGAALIMALLTDLLLTPALLHVIPERRHD